MSSLDHRNSAVAADPDCDSALRSACDAESLELPPLPRIAAEVMRLAALDAATAGLESTTSDRELAALIQHDLALAAQVVRAANCALYARATPVTSLRQAISWLGMIEIRKIAYAFAIKGQLFAASRFRGELSRLWQESVRTALFAQELARLKRRNVETAYLCGLLHRAGVAVILWRLGRGEVAPDPSDRAVLESLASGLEADVGVKLAEHWRLPRGVSMCLRHWRIPQAAPAHRVEVAQTALARALAVTDDHIANRPVASDILTHAQPLLSELDLYTDDLAPLLERRATLFAAAAAFV